jgi:hypothetical protein
MIKSASGFGITITHEAAQVVGEVRANVHVTAPVIGDHIRRPGVTGVIPRCPVHLSTEQMSDESALSFAAFANFPAHFSQSSS